MRAILFASATVTSRTGRRCRTPLVQAPAALFHPAARCTIDVAPSTSSLRISRLPALVIRPSRVFLPAGCRGTRPSQAAKCRALWNTPMSATSAKPKVCAVAAIRHEVVGPMPGTVANRRAASSRRAWATIFASSAPMLSSSARHWPNRAPSTCRAPPAWPHPHRRAS